MKQRCATRVRTIGRAASTVLLAIAGSAAIVLASPAGAADGERWTVIHAGSVLAVPGLAPLPTSSVIVADVIKVMASGGVLDDSRGGLEQRFTDEELRAIVDTAHALGRKVAAHAHGAGTIRAALRAGADSIEHGTLIDDDGIAQGGIVYKRPDAYASMPGQKPQGVEQRCGVASGVG